MKSNGLYFICPNCGEKYWDIEILIQQVLRLPHEEKLQVIRILKEKMGFYKEPNHEN